MIVAPKTNVQGKATAIVSKDRWILTSNSSKLSWIFAAKRGSPPGIGTVPEVERASVKNRPHVCETNTFTEWWQDGDVMASAAAVDVQVGTLSVG